MATDHGESRPPLTARLRAAVKESGLSFNEIARLAGVEQSQLSRFMGGKRDLTLAVASRVCLALGLDLVSVRGVLSEPLEGGEMTTRRRRAEGAGVPPLAEARGRGRRVDLERAGEAASGEGEAKASPRAKKVGRG